MYNPSPDQSVNKSEKPYIRKHYVVRCYKCGMSGHRSFECESKVESQPNKKVTCFNCNKQGHFLNECPEKLSKDKQKGGKGKGKKEGVVLKTNVVSVMGKVRTISGKVNGVETQFLPDTGAEITVVPQELVCSAQVREKNVVIEGSTGCGTTHIHGRTSGCARDRCGGERDRRVKKKIEHSRTRDIVHA